MHNVQEILLFPVRDSESRRQFLLTCLVALAGFIVPILPMLVLMGYSVKTMRQIMEERKNPSMPVWQTSDWSEMMMEGLRLYGVNLVFTLPLFLLLGIGLISVMGGAMSMVISINQNANSFAPVGMSFFFIGIIFFMIFTFLSIPLAILLGAAGPHAVANRSFAAAFQFKDWWQIFRKGLGHFLLGYAVAFAISFVFMFVMQIAYFTIILICVIPFIMVPYIAYIMLITNAFYAQAYALGSDVLKAK